MDVSVVIPAYNEAKRIGATLDAVCAFLSAKSGLRWEVVVVDNRSKDDTAAVARSRAEKWPGIRVVREEQPGKGYAVTAGMLAATGAARLFMDADHSTTIDHYDRMAPFLGEGYDVVIASLTEPGASVRNEGREPLWRVILGKLGNKWIQVFAVWGIGDTQRGFKMFSERAAKDIFPRLTVFGWGFDVEVLAIARARGYRIKEVPVHQWNNAPDSKVNVWAYPQVLLQTLLVFRNRLFGKYR
ncbi:MAG TPA: dolichyl-phosphate beta-glucosyltransferase [Candidatus Paceibacterota bacterium]|nr:dolichyl-phosphate beta-glucosyltransferase [Candidatus Paceibacterota bacterium]